MDSRNDPAQPFWPFPASSWLGALSIASLVPAVPFFILDLHGSPLAVTLAAAVFSVGGFLFTLWAGFLGDRFGARSAALFLSALAIPAGAVLPFVSSVGELFPVRFLMAAAVGLEPIILAAVSHQAHLSQSRPMGQISSAKAIGLSAGPLLPWVIALCFAPSHRFMWIAIAADLALFASLLVLIGRLGRSSSGRVRADDRPIETPRELLRSRHLRLLLLMRFVMGASNGIVLAVGALLVARRFGWGASEYGLLLGGKTVLLIAVRTALTARPTLDDRERTITTASLVLFALSMVIAQAAERPSTFVIAYLFTACANAVLPVVTAVMSTRVGSAGRRTSVMGWGAAAFYAGDLVFTPMGGLLFVVNPRLPFDLVAVGMLSMAAFYGAGVRINEQGDRGHASII